MIANVGSIDRILRIVVGLGLLSLVFVGPQTQWGLIGLIPLATGLFRFCPAYSLIGVNTCGTRKSACTDCLDAVLPPGYLVSLWRATRRHT
jgi:hypothetical protein